jgi:hypothetical protein
MSARKVKAKKSPETDQLRKDFIRTFSERVEARLKYTDKGRAADYIGCSADTITNWLQSTLPDIFEDTRRAALRVLDIAPASVPFGTIIQVHTDGIKTCDAPNVRELPPAMAQDGPAPNAANLDPATMHRLCDQLIARMQDKSLPISEADLVLYRRMLAVIQSVTAHLPNGPTPPTPPDEPSAGNGTTPDEEPPESDDGFDDDGVIP